MLGAGFLQFLKSQSWLSKINQNSVAINHVVLLATSAAGAVGVHAAWNASAGSLTITGINAAAIAAGIWVWAKQWAIQFLVHKGAFGAVAVPAPKP